MVTPQRESKRMFKSESTIRLICPSCSKLRISNLYFDENYSKFICSNVNCAMEYPLINGIPCLISTANDDFHGLLSKIRGLDGKVY